MLISVDPTNKEKKMYKAFAAIALTASLAACGGGGDVKAPDISAAIQQALGNINVPSLPAAPAFNGAFAAVNGVAVGYVAGSSETAVATAIAKGIADAPTTNAANYALLLSDAGLPIKIYGGLSNVKSSITGAFIPLPDTNFVAKLTSGGLVVKQV
jgi:hypothetical protein